MALILSAGDIPTASGAWQGYQIAVWQRIAPARVRLQISLWIEAPLDQPVREQFQQCDQSKMFLDRLLAATAVARDTARHEPALHKQELELIARSTCRAPWSASAAAARQDATWIVGHVGAIYGLERFRTQVASLPSSSWRWRVERRIPTIERSDAITVGTLLDCDQPSGAARGYFLWHWRRTETDRRWQLVLAGIVPISSDLRTPTLR
jgi:hypothetical protein